MNTQEIENTLRKLRLSGMAQTLQTRVMQAQAAQEPFLDTLTSLLQDELDQRRSRLMARRYKLSGLDEKLSLADFDWRFWVFRPNVTACFGIVTGPFGHRDRHLISAHRDRPFRHRDRPFRRS